jgi:hypothetical protein
MIFLWLATLIAATAGGDVVTLGEGSESPVIAGDGQSIVVLWRTDGYTATGQGERAVAYRISHDAARTFGKEQRIVEAEDVRDAIADRGIAHLCLHHDIEGRWNNFYSRVDLTTGSASAPVRLSNNSGSGPTSCRIAVAGSLVAVVWDEAADEHQQRLMLSESTDGGRSFGVSRALGMYPTSQGFPKVAVSAPNVLVVWADSSSTGLFLARADVSSVSPPAKVLDSSVGTVVAAGDNVVVASPAGVRVSHDRGRNLSRAKALVTTAVSGPWLWPEPRIAWSGKNVYVAATVESSKGVYFFYSSDNGATFSKEYAVEPLYPRYSVWDAHVFSVAGQVIVTWETLAQTGQLMIFRVSHDGGQTFDQPVSIPYKSVDSGAYAPAAVHADNRAIYFSWREVVEKRKGVIRFLRMPIH